MLGPLPQLLGLGGGSGDTLELPPRVMGLEMVKLMHRAVNAGAASRFVSSGPNPCSGQER